MQRLEDLDLGIRLEIRAAEIAGLGVVLGAVGAKPGDVLLVEDVQQPRRRA